VNFRFFYREASAQSRPPSGTCPQRDPIQRIGPDHHNFNAGAGGHLRLGTEQPAAEKQIVQRLRAFLLLRICAAAGPEYVHCPGSGK